MTTAQETRDLGPMRFFHVAPWEITLAGGIIKLMIAGAAAAFALLHFETVPLMVGTMLAAGGLIELLISWNGWSTMVGRLTLASGLVTVVAGLLFMSSDWIGLFPLTQCVIIWLFLRAIVSFDVVRLSRRTPLANWGWILLRGATDLTLGGLLLIWGPMAMMTWLVFGATPEMIASFFLVMALSFAVAGAGLIVIALAQRRLHLATPFLS